MVDQLRFVSNNQCKITECQEILGQIGIEVMPIHLKIEEIQTEKTDDLIKDKLLKAFSKIRRPLFVEHTGLYLNHLNGFPGGLTQVFWDTLRADLFAELFGNTRDTSVEARTKVGYTDGKLIKFFEGRISGNIAKEPSGNRDFQWDCIFVPTGYSETFAELGDKKNEISMRRKALDEFSKFLSSEA